MSFLTASYVHGASPIQLIGETVGVYFDKIASRLPDKEAIVIPSQGIRWTYADLKREVDAFAKEKLPIIRYPVTSNLCMTSPKQQTVKYRSLSCGNK